MTTYNQLLPRGYPLEIKLRILDRVPYRFTRTFT